MIGSFNRFHSLPYGILCLAIGILLTTGCDTKAPTILVQPDDPTAVRVRVSETRTSYSTSPTAPAEEKTSATPNVSVTSYTVTNQTETLRSPDAYPVRSYTTENVASFNIAIEESAAANEPWTRSPMLIAHRVLGDISGLFGTLVIKNNRADTPTTSEVTAITGEYEDDSVSAEWRQLRLAKQQDGTWRITEYRKAWLCRRGPVTNAFQKNLCP